MFENREGSRVPDVTFKTRRGSEWVDVTSRELFAGRNVIVFSLPGAFTPTCSSSHVPRFSELQPAFAAAGIDEIVCMSVNDAFVMTEWQKQQCAENLRFVPDGTGEFTHGMGLLVNRDDLGFGQRSWRYSMLVRDGVIEKMFIEPEEDGDPFHVSDADTMLEYVAPGVQQPLDVAVFSRPGCPHCTRAKSLLESRHVAFAELELLKDYPHRALRALTGRETYPQVFINGQHIGGADELEVWFSEAAVA
ncbi:MAG: glutathione peroxidase [Gammaproteobacteria bacterium]|nr:glutathione peroxidase [Gammaproteobacteria bacterium]MBT8445257.1 glutathione peroxidase [Gammaproteobacteria bacterium]NND35806.1 glutathione peroxidase [Gammaproteobacteria bacterium]